jgi:hypothetical protein
MNIFLNFQDGFLTVTSIDLVKWMGWFQELGVNPISHTKVGDCEAYILLN